MGLDARSADTDRGLPVADFVVSLAILTLLVPLFWTLVGYLGPKFSAGLPIAGAVSILATWILRLDPALAVSIAVLVAVAARIHKSQQAYRDDSIASRSGYQWVALCGLGILVAIPCYLELEGVGSSQYGRHLAPQGLAGSLGFVSYTAFALLLGVTIAVHLMAAFETLRHRNGRLALLFGSLLTREMCAIFLSLLATGVRSYR